MAQIKAISNIEFVHNPTSNSTTTSKDHSNHLPAKKKRNLPGTPDPEAEVIALSPKTLMETNRFLCEICGKGFQRDQNLQLHRRGHNLPWKLKQRSTKEPKKRVYVCPEKTCVHNHPSRALGDLTGIKKHFFRKHGEKKWKCDKCSKRYAVLSDWKVHSKTCGTKEYRCDCGTLFSRRDSFITHRAFCDALAEETSRLNATSNMNIDANLNGENINYHFIGTSYSSVLGPILSSQHFVFKSMSNNVDNEASEISQTTHGFPLFMGTNNRTQLGHDSMPNNNNLQERHSLIGSVTSSQATLIFGDPLISFSNPPVPINSDDYQSTLSANKSATLLLHKAAQIGATTSTESSFFGLKSNDQAHDGNKFCGFHTSNPISTDQGNNMEKGIEGDYLMQMYNPAARTRQLVQSDEEWQTRDFLGTEVQPICHPSSINGWI